jgi:hypothetical protein
MGVFRLNTNFGYFKRQGAFMNPCESATVVQHRKRVLRMAPCIHLQVVMGWHLQSRCRQ